MNKRNYELNFEIVETKSGEAKSNYTISVDSLLVARIAFRAAIGVMKNTIIPLSKCRVEKATQHYSGAAGGEGDGDDFQGDDSEKTSDESEGSSTPPDNVY